MARTTRSAAVHMDKKDLEADKLNSVSLPTNRAKMSNKKRKRTSGLESDDLPAAKQPRSDDDETVVKDDEAQAAEHPPLAGELSLKDEDAQKILDILEMVDTQGLLDRVFPLDDVLGIKSPSPPSSSKTPSDSYSLRTLLRESNEHPLRVYRSAIKQLFPISSQPRSRISTPAAQQLRFCQLALSLIEQASQHTIDGLSLKPERVLPDRGSEDESTSVKEPDVIGSRKKYALMQKLPTGEWWTSLNSDLVGADAKLLTDLGTAHAELVAILPSPSSTSKPPPTLGDLHAAKKVQTKLKPPSPRHVSCGTFLDYGPYASFAPSFDNDGGNVGRKGVSGVLWQRYEKGKAREKARILGERMRQKLTAKAGEGMEVDGVMEVDPVEAKAAEWQQEKGKQKELLDKLLAQEESDTVQKALGTLECEEVISELLERNAKALLRLEELQRERFGGEKGSLVEVGSEEWNIAQKVMDSLTLLASMRPRLPNGSASAIVPPASVLRALHQILPSEPSQGWYGTLTESRGLALRDDTTLHVKGSLASQTTAPVSSPTAVPQMPASTYSSNYSYSNYSQQYRGGSSLTYGSQSQSGGYFSSAYSQGASAPQVQKTQSSYASQYSGTSQYPYTPWYPSLSAAGSTVGTPGPGSRKGTPQPAATSSISGSTYAQYSTAVASATPARAVANIVAAKVQANGWATPSAGAGSAYAGSTLPPHMRATGVQGPASPATPSAPLAFGSQSYLSGYQQTPPATLT